MITFHPSAKGARDGFRPMVMVRDPSGRLYGSRCGPESYPTREQARREAVRASLRVAGRLGGIRVVERAQ